MKQCISLSLYFGKLKKIDMKRRFTLKMIFAALILIQVSVGFNSAVAQDEVVELTIVSAVANIEQNETGKINVAGNLLDNDFSTRWSGDGSQGFDAFVTFELETVSRVDSVVVGLYKNLERLSKFDIQTSVDSITFTDGVMGYLTSETDTDPTITIDIPDIKAKYVRLIGHGAWNFDGVTSASAWNSYTELDAYGIVSTSVDTNAQLSAITVDGTAIADFEAGTYVYTVDLAETATDVPLVLGTTMTQTATMEQVTATTLSDSTVIKVTAGDGVTMLNYTIHFAVGGTDVNSEVSLISNVYPNPTTGNVTIQLTELNSNTELTVIDMSGRKILSEQLSQLQTTIDLSDNNSGIYIITVTSNDKLYREKVIIK